MSRLWADLSNNNPRFDAKKYRGAGHRLVGLKVSEGVSFTDKFHAKMCADAHAQKIAVAHYHFAKPSRRTKPENEAAFFWKLCEPHYKKGDYLVLDLEEWHPSGTEVTVNWAIAFCKELRRVSGHTTILYTGQAFLIECGPRILRASRRIWMAQYAQHPKPPFWARPLWAWQRTGDGVGRAPYTLPGCPPNCDVNVLNRRSYRRIIRILK